MARLRPIKRFVLLLDDQPEQTVGGVIVRRELGNAYLDYLVVAVGANEDVPYGPGDRVVLSDPNAGRKVKLDGTVHRVVRVSDIIAKVEV